MSQPLAVTAAIILVLASPAFAADLNTGGQAASATQCETAFAPRAARQPICDALADWSLQTGAKYSYSSWLPSVPVVVAAPGEKVDLADVLRPLGWSIAKTGGVFVVARDGDQARVADLRRTLLEGKDESARRLAAHALGKLTVPAAMTALLEGLADENVNVKFQCLEALMKIESDFGMRALPGRVTMLKLAAANGAQPPSAVPHPSSPSPSQGEGRGEGGSPSPAGGGPGRGESASPSPRGEGRGEGKADESDALLKPLANLAASAADDKPRRAWRYSVELLGRADSPLVRELALAGLKDADERVRLIAARALRETATSADARTIDEFVRNSADWPARREAACCVGVPQLSRDTTTQPDRETEQLLCLRYDAFATRNMSDPKSLAFLSLMLRNGPSDATEHAALALGILGTAEAEKILFRELLLADEPWRRAAMCDGLAMPAKQRSDQAVSKLIELCVRTGRRTEGPAGGIAATFDKADDSALVRSAAARALGVIATEPARKAVLQASKDKDPGVRLAAVRAMKRFGGSAALARLNELASDADAEVKAESLHGLGWLGGVKEAEKLAAIAKDKSLGRDGPGDAILGLGALLPPAARDIAVATLLELMNDPKSCPWMVGRAAVELNDPRLLPGLLKVLGQNRAGAPLRVDCVDAIAQLGTKQTTETLAKNWWEYENMARYQHGRALRENLDTGEVFETLLALAGKTDAGDAHLAAVFSLSNSRDPAAVAALVEIMTTKKGNVIGAATSLGLIADPAATDALLAAATDATHPGRFVAARALRQRDLAWQPKVKAALVKLYGWREDGTPPPVAEQKPGTWMLRRYQRDFDDMTVSTLTYESAICYDSTRGRVFHWGAHGKRYDSPQTGDTWVYHGDDNTWTELGLRERPPGTCMTRQICYDSTNDKLIVRGASGGGHGWLYFREQRLRQSSPWVYDPQTDRWLAMRAPRPEGVALSNLNEFDAGNGVVIWAGRPAVPPSPKLPAGSPKPPPPPPQPIVITTYDAYTNTFTVPATQPDRPAGVGFQAAAYDSRRGRTLFLASNQLWAYSLSDNKWTNLKPGGEWPTKNSLLVYDSANDAALTFRGSRIYAYDCVKNEWIGGTGSQPVSDQSQVENLRYQMQPDYHNWDATYDAKHNVIVVAGGEITSCPGSPNVRETWTYRLDPALFSRRAAGPRVEPPTVRPVARAQPPVVTGVVATWNAEKKACVRWDKSPAADVIGYNVYRAVVTPSPLDSGGVAGMTEYVKINDKPVEMCEFVDPEVGSDRFNNEPLPAGWALAPRAYRVAAVNKAGIESGPAGRALTLPDTTRSIQTRRRDDGSVVVRWEKDPDPNVVGYFVFRQDNWANGHATKLNPVPVVGTTFIDPADGIPAGARPSGERQRYWVVGVDRFGQLGPSGTGAWSFNR